MQLARELKKVGDLSKIGNLGGQHVNPGDGGQ